MATESSLTLISDERVQGILDYFQSSDEIIRLLAELSSQYHKLGLASWSGNFPYDDISTKLLKKRPEVLKVCHISCVRLSDESLADAELDKDTQTQWYSVWITIVNFGPNTLTVSASLGNKEYGWAADKLCTVTADPGKKATFNFLVPADYFGSKYFVCGMGNALNRFNLDFVIGFAGKLSEA